jgi:hypothetical protein
VDVLHPAAAALVGRADFDPLNSLVQDRTVQVVDSHRAVLDPPDELLLIRSAVFA